MDVGRLIDLVRRNVFLYDMCHKDYKNPSLKAATWELIGKELNETGDTCRLKWKTVRDSYIKYKRLLKTSNSSKEVVYIWSSNLKFLDNHNVNRTSIYKPTNMKSEFNPSLLKEMTVSQDQDSFTSIFSPLVSTEPISTGTDVGSETYQSNKDSRINMNDQSTKLKDVDATDLLFLSYSGTFKRFSARQQALLKLELAKLFATAELEHLDSSDQLRQSTVDLETSENTFPVIIKTEYEGNPDVDSTKVKRTKRTRHGSPRYGDE